MDTQWAEKEFHAIDLGDQRLKERLIILATRLSDSPESPINHACDDWAETKAAYRFFNNCSVDYNAIIKSHSKATASRCIGYSTVLAIQDTTYFNYSSHRATKGLCPIAVTKGHNTKDIITSGLIMHSTLIVTTDGLPLGIIDQKIYSRPQLSDDQNKQRGKAHTYGLSVEEKESYRWIESIHHTQQNFKDRPARVVTIADREADIYDLFQRAQEINALLLIRANFNRKINKESTNATNTGELLWTFMKNKDAQAEITVMIPEQEKNPSREAHCTVTFSAFTMHPPQRHGGRSSHRQQSLSLYAMYLVEKNQPSGVEPIEWMLLTNIAIVTAEDAVEKISWYCLRWKIEIFHKILKSGLKVEDCRLSTSERLIRYLAVMSIIAWRIFWITLIARITPTMPCSLLLNDTEWKILYLKYNPKRSIPLQSPTLEQCVRWISQLGGFLARKSDKDPGITHLWRGLRKFSALLEGAEIAKQL
jgi:hypothetical protein